MFSAEILNAQLPYLFGNEIDYLRQLGKQLPDDSHVVMLGVGPALMLLALYEDRTMPLYTWGYDIVDIEYAKVHLEAIGKSHWAVFTYCDSVQASEEWEDEEVDLLLIDACHTFECVDKDIQAWWPKIAIGGILFFHDYIPHERDTCINGVRAAIEKHKNLAWKELGRPGISIVFKKLDR